ncbi:AAA family ATPase [Patescibacteria group bacterium]
MTNLPAILLKAPLWWATHCSKRIFQIFWRLTQLINAQFSFTTNVRLLFVPLFGDYTIIGRFIGFFTRIFFIIFGFIFVGFLSALSLIMPVIWLVLPIISVWKIGLAYTILAYVVLVGIYFFSNLKVPLKKVSKIKGEHYLLAFRPEAKSTSLRTILRNGKILRVFKKAELSNSELFSKLQKLKPNIKEVRKHAFEFAKEQETRYVEVEHLLLGFLKSTKKIENLLATYGGNLKTLEESAKWLVQKRENLSKAYFWQEDYDMPPMGGFGHGMTGRVTPNLDAISTDYTKLAKLGRIKKIIWREAQIEKIAHGLGGTNINVLVIGEAGSGKTTLIKGLAYQIIRGTKFKSLKNKRIVELNLGGIVSGAKTTGDVAKRLTAAFDEIRGSKDIILFVDEIHSLAMGLGGEEEDFSSIYAILEPQLSSSDFQFIGATTTKNYRKYIEPHGAFANLFEMVEIPEASNEKTLEILQFEAEKREQKLGIEITYPALSTIVELSKKLIQERVFPDKAISLLNKAADLADASTGILNSEVSKKIIADVTHLPVQTLSKKDTQKLLNIADEMKTRVIGQNYAIEKIAAALKRAGAGIRDENKPIASFLFVGTTGVGKTETAKTLSGKYFGDRKAMVRLDMSEYQTPDSINKLIGNPDASTMGILTEQVRSKPFTVVLLDEVEKAHSQIILTFLQVLDDGRLTQPNGRVIDFTNTIIIATSNAGTREIQRVFERRGTFEEIEEVATNAVREQFAPEFLNRFTGIITFRPLERDTVRKIALILLERVKKMAKGKNIEVSFSEELVDELMLRGFNPEWGARPMARVIEDNVETYLAERILSGEINQGDTIKLGPEVFS